MSERHAFVRCEHDIGMCTRREGVLSCHALLCGKPASDPCHEEADATAAPPSHNDSLMDAWGVIANAGGGDWTKETPDWQTAAAHWRDTYLHTINTETPTEPPPSAWQDWQAIDYRVRNWIINALLHPMATGTHGRGIYRDTTLSEREFEERRNAARAAINLLGTGYALALEAEEESSLEEKAVDLLRMWERWYFTDSNEHDRDTAAYLTRAFLSEREERARAARAAMAVLET